MLQMWHVFQNIIFRDFLNNIQDLLSMTILRLEEYAERKNYCRHQDTPLLTWRLHRAFLVLLPLIEPLRS